MNEQIQRVIDWQLDQDSFRRQVIEIIAAAKNNGKVITLPIVLQPGQAMIDHLTLLLAQVNCAGCNALCCRENPGDEPLSLLPSEYEKLTREYSLDALDKIEDGTYGLPMPCPFLESNLCKIYRDRPLVCVLYPFQTGGADAAGNPLLAISSSCPESQRIAANVFMWAWRIRKHFVSLSGEDLILSKGILT